MQPLSGSDADIYVHQFPDCFGDKNNYEDAHLYPHSYADLHCYAYPHHKPDIHGHEDDH